MLISKMIEFDMGHRIPHHDSQCKNLHGHRYKLVVQLEGDIVEDPSTSSEGMVLDFSYIKRILMDEIHTSCDHAFMFYKNDKILAQFFKKNKGLKKMAVPFIPTAENIAQWAFYRLSDKFKHKYDTNLQLKSVCLWETPTSYALFSKEDVTNEKK